MPVRHLRSPTLQELTYKTAANVVSSNLHLAPTGPQYAPQQILSNSTVQDTVLGMPSKLKILEILNEVSYALANSLFMCPHTGSTMLEEMNLALSPCPGLPVWSDSLSNRIEFG